MELNMKCPDCGGMMEYMGMDGNEQFWACLSCDSIIEINWPLSRDEYKMDDGMNGYEF